MSTEKTTVYHVDPVRDAYVIRDNGRRGEPLPGCDCMRCFGMCLIDPDIAHREISERFETAETEEAAL